MTTPEIDSPGTYINGQVMYPRSYVEQLEQRLAEAEKVIAMVIDNTKMPHQHSDPQLRLYCLAERGSEYQAKWKVEG